MPKVMYNPERVQKQKRAIGIVAIVLMLIVAVVVMIYRLSFYVWIPLDLIIFGVASLLLRRVGKVPL
jgi:hypothetical protein